MGSLGLSFQKYVKKDSFKKTRKYSEITNLIKKLRKLDVVFLGKVQINLQIIKSLLS